MRSITPESCSFSSSLSSLSLNKTPFSSSMAFSDMVRASSSDLSNSSLLTVILSPLARLVLSRVDSLNSSILGCSSRGLSSLITFSSVISSFCSVSSFSSSSCSFFSFSGCNGSWSASCFIFLGVIGGVFISSAEDLSIWVRLRSSSCSFFCSRSDASLFSSKSS